MGCRHHLISDTILSQSSTQRVVIVGALIAPSPLNLRGKDTYETDEDEMKTAEDE